MELFAILRRDGFTDGPTLEAAAARSTEAIRKHAAEADLAVTEIIPIADTVIVRPDPD